MTDDYSLRVTGPTWQGVVEIDAEVDEDDGWGEDAEASDPEETVEVDASAAVAEHVVELLGNARIDWPACPTHGTQLRTRGGVWTCPGGAHDPAAVGQLGAS